MTAGATFIHEASHAVAARLLHGQARAIVVYAEGDAYTKSLFLRDADPADLIAYLLAGRAAELAAGYPVDRRDSHDDQGRALAIARNAAWPNISRIDEMAAVLLERSEQRARRLVDANLREIRHVAATLTAAGGRLAGPQVQAALLAAFGSSWEAGIPRLNPVAGTGQPSFARAARIGRQELQARAKLAEKFPTEKALSDAVRQWPTRRAIGLQTGPLRARPGLVRPLVLLRGRLADLP